MKRFHTLIFALLIIVCTGVLAAIWRFWLEEWIDPWFGHMHNASKFFEDIEFIIVSIVFVILAIIPAGLFAARTIRLQEQLEKKLLLSDAIIQHANEGILVTDTENRIIFVNPAFTDISGYSFQDVVWKNPNIFSSQQHDDNFYQDMWKRIRAEGKWAGEIWNKRKDGSLYVQRLSIFTLLFDQDAARYHAAFFNDITEQKRNEEKVVWQATHDGLTKLYNRKHFIESLQLRILNARLHQKKLALLFIDLDGFKPVNDTYGHEVGDLLLIRVAEVLQKTVRHDDVVARQGGDEFVIMIGIREMADAELVANKLVKLLSTPQMIANHEIHFGASIGVALFPEDGLEPDELLHRADEGMYAAKRAGKNIWRRISQSPTKAA
ncbi:MAG: diguanylate cyclase [Magnetococcus sp. YQC-5]